MPSLTIPSKVIFFKQTRADKLLEEQHKNDFISFDQNQDGFVDAQEVRDVFKNLSQEELSAFFIAADKNENGVIDFEEYVHASLTHGDKDLTLDDF